MASEMYRVKLEGEGLVLEREVTKDVGQRIAVLVLTGAGDTQGLPRRGAIDQVAQLEGHSANLSLREFILKHEPKRSPDKIVAIGVYLSDHAHKDSFAREDLEEAFQAAGEAMPGNLFRDVKWAVRTGWIAPKPGAKNRYYVTNSGREAVTQRFPKQMLVKTRIESAKRTPKKRAAGS
jgi:hypothetical protein